MNASNIIGQFSAVLAVVAAIPYVKSILRGETKPNRASWFIWAAVSFSLLASYHYSGASTTIWLTGIYTVTTTIVFLLSLKYGVGGYTSLDVICLMGAAIGLLLWWATNSPVTALYINVLVDALGFFPTIKKAYLEPASESKLSWNISVLANVLNVAALTTWRFKIALFPIYNLTFNLIIAVLLYGLVQGKRKAQKR